MLVEDYVAVMVAELGRSLLVAVVGVWVSSGAGDLYTYIFLILNVLPPLALTCGSAFSKDAFLLSWWAASRFANPCVFWLSS